MNSEIIISKRFNLLLLFVSIILFIGVMLFIFLPLIHPEVQSKYISIDPKELLIPLESLPGWEINGRLEELSPRDSCSTNNLGGYSMSYIIDHSSTANQTIVKFNNISDAVIGYKAHDFTGDTEGYYGTTWKEIADINYKSRNAKNFRFVCSTTKNIDNTKVSACAYESQYDIFLSIIKYSSINLEKINDEIIFFALAADAQMEKYIR